MQRMAEVEQPVAKFETSLGELEKVVRELEAGDLPLERSLELFERGVEPERTMPQTARRG